MDTSIRVDEGKTRIGGVLRDHNGKVSVAWSKQIARNFSVEVEELLVVHDGLHTALARGLKVDLLETDAIRVVSCIQNQKILSDSRAIVLRFCVFLSQLVVVLDILFLAGEIK